MTPTDLQTLIESFKGVTVTTDVPNNRLIIQLPSVKEEVKEWPQMGDRYFAPSVHGPRFETWEGRPIDQHLLELGLAFRTREECEVQVNRQRAYVRLCRKRDELGGEVTNGGAAKLVPTFINGKWSYEMNNTASDFAFNPLGLNCRDFCDAMSADLSTYYAPAAL